MVDRHRSGREALLLLLVPPAVVVAALAGLHSVWAVFLAYHFGICLLWPLIDNVLLRRRTWRAHAREVGWTGGRVGAGLLAGLVLGVAMAAGSWFGFQVLEGVLLVDQRVLDGLAGWGVDRSHSGALLAVMLLLNGPAEESYWRGHVQTRLAGWRPRPAAIAAAALAYASYHGVTLLVLLGSWSAALPALLAVFAAGCFWGWLRERFGNAWPAMLGHAGATVGYMIVYWGRFARP
ncbi:CPBP family intramembrane metalloprotease [bacterium]|nr:CPBP family intramembrane metalloprotease [bacterium]